MIINYTQHQSNRAYAGSNCTPIGHCAARPGHPPWWFGWIFIGIDRSPICKKVVNLMINGRTLAYKSSEVRESMNWKTFIVWCARFTWLVP